MSGPLGLTVCQDQWSVPSKSRSGNSISGCYDRAVRQLHVWPLPSLSGVWRTAVPWQQPVGIVSPVRHSVLRTISVTQPGNLVSIYDIAELGLGGPRRLQRIV